MSVERDHVIRAPDSKGKWKYYSFHSAGKKWVDVIQAATLMTEEEAKEALWDADHYAQGGAEVFKCGTDPEPDPLDQPEATSGYAEPRNAYAAGPPASQADVFIVASSDMRGEECYYEREGEWTYKMDDAVHMDKATANRVARSFIEMDKRDKTVQVIRTPQGERDWLWRQKDELVRSMKENIERMHELYDQALKWKP